MDPTGPMPIPRDIPLPLPADQVLLQAFVVMLFLLHIVFVNLMVGGSVLVLVAETAGLRRRDYGTLAREMAKTITVNKSLAVVLGVGPLLVVNVLYTVYFYTANALTGGAWISIVPLVCLAFLLTYAHKYSWDRLAGAPRVHIALGAAATFLFLLVPLIFLTNINLMLFPARWTQVRGFLSALVLPNVLPRYAHFLMACIAVTALFLVGYLTRRSYPVETVFETLDRPGLRRVLYGIALAATGAQLFVGPLVYFTLPGQGVGWFMTGAILAGAAAACGAVVLLMMELVSPPQRIGSLYTPIVVLIVLTGCCMGYGRHLYREGALGPHRALVARKTEDFQWYSAAASLQAGPGLADPYADLPPGEQVFRRICASCHAADRILVGPPLTEIATIYRDNPAGIVAWTKNPGRKRKDLSPMPALRLPEEKLRAVAEYVLEAGAETGPAADESTDQPAPAGQP